MRGITTSILGLATVGLSLLSGCPDREISRVLPEQGRVEYKDIPVTVNRKVDILFVIDDSGSMADKQQNLAQNFPDFITVLRTIQGGLPDVHIGVVTSDMGAKATQDPAPASGVAGCTGTGKNGNLVTNGATVMGNFISDVSAGDPNDPTARITNYTGDLGQVFSTMARVGAAGCGFEQHLEAMRKALNGNPANANFIRNEAYLAVIFLADEDDCSISRTSILGPTSASLGKQSSFRCTRFGVTCDQGGATTDAMNQVGTKGQCHPNENSQYLEKVDTYVQFLKSLKGDPTKVIVAGILGTTEPFQVELRTPPGGNEQEQALAHSCTYQGETNVQVADPPIRLKYFLDQFPNRSTFTTICQRNLSDGLQLIAQLLKTVIGDPCIEGNLRDFDPGDGVQYDCSVSDVENPGQPNQTETILPECTPSSENATNKPCWRIAQDPVNCPADPENGKNHTNVLKIERNTMPADNVHVIANCVTDVIDIDGD